MSDKKSRKTTLDWRGMVEGLTKQSKVVALTTQQGSPLESGQVVMDDDAYLRLRLLSFYHPVVRRGWMQQQPIVYANAKWRQPSLGGVPEAKIITPTILDNPEAKQGGAFAFQGQVLFGPMRYNGALDFSLGMLLRRSNTKARKALDAVGQGLKLVTMNGLLVLDLGNKADAVIDMAKWLLPDGNSQFLIGASWDLPGENPAIETGCWAVLSPDQKNEAVWLDSADNRLKTVSGEPITTPYLVYSIDAIKSNPDRARIPDVAEAWARVREGLANVRDLNTDSVKELFQLYCLTVQMHEQLNRHDKTELIEAARREFDGVIAIRDDVFATDKPDADRAKAKPAELSEIDRTFTPEPEAPVDEPDVAAEPAVRRVAAATAELKEDAVVLQSADTQLGEERLALLSAKVDEAIDVLVTAAARDPETHKQAVEDAGALLRKRRLWDSVARLEKELHDKGVDYPRMAYYAAAAAVERGDLAGGESRAAWGLMLAREEGETYNASEALALQGRVWKERAVSKAKMTDEERQAAYERAISYYRDGDIALQEASPGDPFQKVNILALIDSARRNGMSVGKGIPASKWARETVKAVSKAERNDKSNLYDYANAGDASLFMGKRDEAAGWYKKYLEEAAINPFALNATRRQLVEVWGIDPAGTDAMGQIVRTMAAAAIAQSAEITLAAEEVRAIVRQPMGEIEGLESLIGGTPTTPIKVLQRVLEMGTFVGKVARSNGRPAGSGFLIPGGELHPSWAGEMLFMTNDHVIRENPIPGLSVPPGEAVVFFEQIDPSIPFQVKEIVWRSDVQDGSDCAIVRLFETPSVPAHVKPIEIAEHLPQRWRSGSGQMSDEDEQSKSPRVFIVQHPGGREMAISTSNNIMIDHEQTDAPAPATERKVRIHYRAPTEGGSSGSPVFLASTAQLIALHHKGYERGQAPLNNLPPPAQGVYKANEGHWIAAIRAEIAADLAQRPTPPAGQPPQEAPRTEPAPAPAAPRPDIRVSSPQMRTPISMPAFTPTGFNPAAPVGRSLEGIEEPDFWDYAEGEGRPPQAGLEGASSNDWKTLANKPVASYAPLHAHPDTAHIAQVPVAASDHDAFHLDARVLRKALAFANIPVEGRWSQRVLFGIRGASPLAHTGDTTPPVFQSGFELAEIAPDHVNYRCTMGVWNLQNESLWVVPASTVPAVGYMWRQTKREPGESNVSNLLSPGIYTFRVGCHQAASSSRQAGAFRQASKYCVLRSNGPDLQFNADDPWDWDTDASGPQICDNIHGGIGGSDAWVARHYSAGCQVIDGYVDQRDGPRPTPTRQWANFREAAGLRRVPSMRPGSVTETSEDGTAYTYVLLTAREVRLAAENLHADDQDPRFAKLRRGSQGPRVRALQEALGITADGDFGFGTQRAVLKKQTELKQAAAPGTVIVDGIVNAANAADFGLQWDGPAQQEQPVAHHAMPMT